MEVRNQVFRNEKSNSQGLLPECLKILGESWPKKNTFAEYFCKLRSSVFVDFEDNKVVLSVKFFSWLDFDFTLTQNKLKTFP